MTFATTTLADTLEPAAPAIQRTARGALSLVLLVLFAASMLRTVFGPLQEAAKLDLNLSDFQVSIVQGVASSFPVAIFGLPLGWIVDHGNRVRLMTALLSICVIGTLWTGFAQGFVSLVLARMLSGMGATCALGAIISLLADWCPPDRRGRALVVMTIGVLFGTALAFALGGVVFGVLQKHPLALLGSMVPWRATHLIFGLVSSLLLLPMFALKEPQRREIEQNNPGLRPTLQALWSKRRFLLPLFAGQLGVGMADGAAAIWAAPVLIRKFHLQPQQFSVWLGGVMLLAGLIGAALGGFSADWGQKSGRRGALLLGAVLATAIGIPTALYPMMPTVTGFAILLSLLMLSGAVISIVASTTITVLIPNEERGVCMAAFGVISGIVVGITPMLVTLASSVMGGESHLDVALAATGVFTAVLSLAGYFYAMRNAPLHSLDHSSR